MNRFFTIFIFILSLSSVCISASAEGNRARALSENSLANLLMDLRMAKEDLSRSERTYEIPMFAYGQFDGDLDIIIKNLEHFLYPKVTIKEKAVPIRLDGRYFKAAIEENTIITPLPSSQLKRISLSDLPEVPSTPDGITKKDIQHLQNITRKDTVIVVREKEKVEKEVHTLETVHEVTHEVIKEVVKEVAVEPTINTRLSNEAPSTPAGVLYAWERNYNKKDIENMMLLYSPQFKGGNGKKEKRRDDFRRDFIAFPDAVIRIYNLSISSEIDGQEKEKLWHVDFDAEMSGKQWKEYQHGNFIINKGLKLIDETWTQAIPVEEETGS